MLSPDVVTEMIIRATRIEREKDSRALTEDEAGCLVAIAFLRQIAPYLFPESS